MPVGISGFGEYKHKFERYINVDRIYQYIASADPLTINYPWFDHPPTLGLITGGVAYLSGAKYFEDTTAAVIRRPMVIIGTISVLLVVVFGWINYGFLTGVVGGLIFASVPLVVLSSRMIQSENAIIPCFLACMILMAKYLKTNKSKWLLTAAIVAGLASLFKLSGVACHLLAIMVLLGRYGLSSKKAWSDVLFFLAVSLPITGWYAAYGLAYDGKTFIKILFSNYDRFYGIGPQALVDLVKYQRLTQGKFLTEGWLIAGWMSWLALMARNRRKHLILVSAVLAYLITYVLFGSQPYGWYAFPFWPLLNICLGVLVVEGIKDRKAAMPPIVLMLLVLGDNISRLIGLDDFQPWSDIWRVGISFGLLLSMSSWWFNKKQMPVYRAMILALFIVLIYLNVRYMNQVTVEYWWQNVS